MARFSGLVWLYFLLMVPATAALNATTLELTDLPTPLAEKAHDYCGYGKCRQKALALNAPVVSAVCLGVVTATFGALAADVMTGHADLLAKPSYWLASSLTCGSIVFVVVSLTLGEWPAVFVSIAVSTSFYYVSYVRDWPAPQWPGHSRRAPEARSQGEPQT